MGHNLQCYRYQLVDDGPNRTQPLYSMIIHTRQQVYWSHKCWSQQITVAQVLVATKLHLHMQLASMSDRHARMTNRCGYGTYLSYINVCWA